MQKTTETLHTLQWMTNGLKLNPEQHVRIGDALAHIEDMQIKIEKLEEINKLLTVSNEFYASLDSWYSEGFLHRQLIFSSDMENLGSSNSGGKLARETKNKIEEIIKGLKLRR